MAQSRFGGPSKQSIVDVADGLFILRYKSSVAARPPLVTFADAPTSAGRLTILEQPGAIAGSLERPGDVAALAVQGTVRLEFIVEARGSDCTAEAEIDLERISVEGRSAALPITLPARAGTVSTRGEEGGLSLLAHVSRRGDVVASGGEWIAGPSAPAPIEGVEIKTGFGIRGFEIQVLVSGEDRWSPWVGADTYVGTRGRARALAGLRLRLNSEAPADLRLDASALFLGSAINRQTGRAIELLSASGRDPLIGLSIRLMDEPPSVASPEGARHAAPPARRERGRVRVFRAGAEIVGTEAALRG